MHRALWFAFVYALLAAVVLVFGVEAVWTLAIPPALCAVPLLVAVHGSTASVRRVTVICLLLLALFIFVGLMSVGGVFAPSAIALAVGINAADRADREAPRPAV